MSHFTVLIIGEDPETQLEPFDENMEMDEYCKGEVPEEEKQEFMEYYAEKGDNPDDKLSFDELYALKGGIWNGNMWRKNDEGVWSIYSTYNPNSKWDWYELGGRWTGFFKVKPNVRKTNYVVGSPGLMTQGARKNYADQIRKKYIDFDGMMDNAEKNFRKEYAKILELFGGVIPKVEHTWETIIDKNNPFFSKMDIKEKREFYHNQPAIKKVEEVGKNNKLGWGFDIEDYQKPLDELVVEKRRDSFMTFAVIKDGVWYERGQMGWWGCAFNENKNWEVELEKLIKDIPEDTMLSVYDCHI